MEQKISNGQLKVSKEVIESIVEIAVGEVSGAILLKDNFVDKFKKKSGSDLIEFTDESVIVNVNISAVYGVKIPDLVKEVQMNIASNINVMTGVNVLGVNVFVSEIHVEDKNI